MTTNPILDELRAAREKLLADAGGDLRQLVLDTRARQASSERTVFYGPIQNHRTNRCTGAAKPSDLTVETQTSPLLP